MPEQVAKHLKTEHHELIVEPSAVEVLPSLVQHYDEPFSDSSCIPTWYVAQFTREHVTVAAISGDGGDELFAGYPRYKAIDLAHKIDRITPLKFLLTLPQINEILPYGRKYKGFFRRLKRFLRSLHYSPEYRYLWTGSIYSPTPIVCYFTLTNSNPAWKITTRLNSSLRHGNLLRIDLQFQKHHLETSLLTYPVI